jgi:hypothetical protein
LVDAALGDGPPSGATVGDDGLEGSEVGGVVEPGNGPPVGVKVGDAEPAAVKVDEMSPMDAGVSDSPPADGVRPEERASSFEVPVGVARRARMAEGSGIPCPLIGPSRTTRKAESRRISAIHNPIQTAGFLSGSFHLNLRFIAEPFWSLAIFLLM